MTGMIRLPGIPPTGLCGIQQKSVFICVFRGITQCVAAKSDEPPGRSYKTGVRSGIRFVTLGLSKVEVAEGLGAVGLGLRVRGQYAYD